jgi:hypothetical protein
VAPNLTNLARWNIATGALLTAAASSVNLGRSSRVCLNDYVVVVVVLWFVTIDFHRQREALLHYLIHVENMLHLGIWIAVVFFFLLPSNCVFLNCGFRRYIVNGMQTYHEVCLFIFMILIYMLVIILNF